MPARRTSAHSAAPRARARHRRVKSTSPLRAHLPTLTVIAAALTAVALVTAVLSGQASSALAEPPLPSVLGGNVVAASTAPSAAAEFYDVAQDRARALRARESAIARAAALAKAAARTKAVKAQWTRNKKLAAQARQRDRQAALAWARGRTDAQARAAAAAWARSFRAAGGRAYQERQAASILARVPASASRLQAASMIKNSDLVGRRDGEWVRANRTVVKHSARAAAVMLLDDYGFDLTQWGCLDRLWWQESNWRWNSRTGETYGIPQALPGSKMASAGADWATNPVTQIKWGLGYVKARYGTPCDAWRFWAAHTWY